MPTFVQVLAIEVRNNGLKCIGLCLIEYRGKGALKWAFVTNCFCSIHEHELNIADVQGFFGTRMNSKDVQENFLGQE